MDGFLVVDKPLGHTSRDALDRVQASLPPDVRVGHAGTLDPLATGVLVVALGQATRLVEQVQRQTKVYRALVRFGAFTETDDAEGEPVPVADAPPVDRQALDAALVRFLGEIEQTPPAFSAAHVGGRRAYRLARRGKPVELAPRTVRVDRIDVLAYAYPDLDVEIVCGKGTYIRSLARDWGRLLGCGGYLAGLRRTRIGPFRVQDAVAPDADLASIAAALRPLVDAFDGLPRMTFDDATLVRLAYGQAIPCEPDAAAESAALDATGRLRAVVTRDGDRLRPTKVFPA